MINFKKSILFLYFFVLSLSAFAFNTSRTGIQMRSPSVWLAQESEVAQIRLLKNISPLNTVPGTVIASPQTENPNYFRHWTRDAALTMDVVFKMAKINRDPEKAKYFNQLLKDYAALSRQNQTAYIGEPIYEVNGMVFLGPWGRPQNDGPALRAIALIEWANQLLDQGETAYVRDHLYQAAMPPNSVIKVDLEYVSWHWADPCFDLWEEVKANHFYTKMVQRKSLLLGAQLARRLNDKSASDWYELQAGFIEKSILTHLSENQDMIGASLNFTEGLNSKVSNLDISVILGVLHGGYDKFFNASYLPVQKTFDRLKNVFAQIYPVNQNHLNMGIALGRYPEDIYAGTNFNGGNPWVLSTLAGAEYSYRVAAQTAAQDVVRAQKWIQLGDDFVQRVQFHANADGSLSEQIDRYGGFMTSARDLTWNYSAVMTTLWARQESQKTLLKILKKGKPNE